MTIEQQLRLECLREAVRTPGNPNTLQLAEKYLAFVNAGSEVSKDTSPVKQASKGTRK